MEIKPDEQMGRTKLVDKSVKPMSTVQSITPSNFIVGARTPAYGAVVLGDYKGTARFLDLDKLVNQPLVWAEQQHILGILDGREEDYDLQTISPPVGATVGATYTASLTVPTGQTWYVNAVVVTLDSTGSNHGVSANWHCSLWTDRAATPSQYGQPFHGQNLAIANNATNVWWDEFYVGGPVWQLTNKPVLLRLPAGTTITFVVIITTAAVTVELDNTLALYGFVTKALVS